MPDITEELIKQIQESLRKSDTVELKKTSAGILVIEVQRKVKTKLL